MAVAMLAVLAGVAFSALATALWPPRRAPRIPEGLPSNGLRRPGGTSGPGVPAGGPGQSVHRLAGAVAAGGVRGVERVRDSRVVAWAGRRGPGLRVQAADLAVTGLEPDAVHAVKIIVVTGCAILAGGAGLVSVRMLGTGGQGLLVGFVLVAATVGAYLIPDMLVRAQARRRREEFVRALPVWCDLVALEMAGAAAAQEALVTAAEAGTTWPMLVLRDTLHRATRARQGHWQALTDLGEQIAVGDLAELGRLSQLVSHEGAQVRDTLIERAAAIRRRELAQALGQAGQRDESMRLAVLVIAAGVILLMIYPGAIAVVRL
ncbi:hypothetical protein KIH74_35015 [Kineosporia sp. J2-2]|uniref:Flp pilus assembly protein TadB n=1 Tax=Kineosporia corallincola TaxID=2835133 RepID=A0ABS5TTT4_9ACTN|nr:hypothetical protein [Kineosporia corallincola]MBT0774209.1 hypothetical protein [Kineosporia corallincola]